jgi:hypothetical protein
MMEEEEMKEATRTLNIASVSGLVRVGALPGCTHGLVAIACRAYVYSQASGNRYHDAYP